MRPRKPHLAPHVLADPERLWQAIDEVICTMRGNGKRRRHIVQLQQRLNDAVDLKSWSIYLDIEAATNARVEVMLIEVVRWAFDEGRRRSRGR